MSAGPGLIWLVRHGETGWSRDGRHTSRTDLALTRRGREQARALAPVLARLDLARVLVSPLRRARQTAELAGLSGAEVREALREWDYGDYEGLSTVAIRRTRPGWRLWDDGCPGGEPLQAVGERADSVIEEVRSGGGDVALVAHGHVLRILAARWIGCVPGHGRHLLLSTGRLSALGYEHDVPVIERWNVPAGGAVSAAEGTVGAAASHGAGASGFAV